MTALLDTAELPAADRRARAGRPAARCPQAAGVPADSPVIRMLVRVPRDGGLALAAALRRATGVLSARHDQQPVRVQIDPLHIG